MPGSERIAFLGEHASPIALRDGEDAGGQNVYVDDVSRNVGRLGFAVDIFTRHAGADVPQAMRGLQTSASSIVPPARSMVMSRSWYGNSDR